jgi:hypothetical protein
MKNISLANLANLLVSIGLALTLLYFGHNGLEVELARPNRSLWVMGFYGGMIVLGLLAAPTIRDRVVAGAKAGFTLVRDGRRVTDRYVELPDATPPAAIVPSVEDKKP